MSAGTGAGPGGHLPQGGAPYTMMASDPAAAAAAAAESAAAEPEGFTTNAEDLAGAAAMRAGGGAAAAADPAVDATALESLAAVKIDPDAVQKYVLIEATDVANFASRHLVRGDQYADYHKDAARETIIELDELGLRYNVLGTANFD